MTIQLIAFASGLALVAIGILGGGIEAKEIRLPQLTTASRVLSAAFGLALLAGAMGALDGLQKRLEGSQPPGPPVVPPPVAPPVVSPVQPPPPVSTPVQPPAPKPPAPRPPAPKPSAPRPPHPAPPVLHEATIVDGIGTDQVYEKVTIFVNGKPVGKLSISDTDTTDSLTLKVKAGDSYRLVGVLGVNEGGSLVRYQTGGAGFFKAPLIDRYQVVNKTGDRRVIYLGRQ